MRLWPFQRQRGQRSRSRPVTITAEGDWRLRGQEQLLARRAVRWAVWWPYREGWDHDHCDFCWAEISDRPIDEHTKYNAAWVTADDDYHWICPACFNDFRERFLWSVAESPESA